MAKSHGLEKSFFGQKIPMVFFILVAWAKGPRMVRKMPEVGIGMANWPLPTDWRPSLLQYLELVLLRKEVLKMVSSQHTISTDSYSTFQTILNVWFFMIILSNIGPYDIVYYDVYHCMVELAPLTGLGRQFHLAPNHHSETLGDIGWLGGFNCFYIHPYLGLRNPDD